LCKKTNGERIMSRILFSIIGGALFLVNYASAETSVVIKNTPQISAEKMVIDKKAIIFTISGKTISVPYENIINTQSKNPSTTAKPQEVNSLAKVNSLAEALQKNSKLYFFHRKKGELNRLKILGKYSYTVFQEADPFKVCKYQNKYYAKSENGKIYEPHWEINNNFSVYLISQDEYLQMLNKALNTCNKKITDIDTQIANSKALKNKLQKKHFDILKAQNLSTKKVYDSNGQFKEIHESENKYSSKLKRMFKQLERDIKAEDKKQEKLNKQKGSFDKQLKYLKQLKEKAQKNPFTKNM
jgi:hypothetical protein